MFMHRTPFGAFVGCMVVACAGVQVPQARVHSGPEFDTELRAQAAEDMACPAADLRVEPNGTRRYAVEGCSAQATYCCYERALEVFCSKTQAQAGGTCHEPPLEPPPEPGQFRPVSAEDYGVLLPP